MTRRQPVVAIDGPAGAGKSTAARMLAERLGFVLVDTGALYRAVALIAKERGVAWHDEARLGPLASGLDLAFVRSERGTRLHIDGKDRGDDIRAPDISRGASDVSKLPAVRAALLGLQRDLGKDGGVVLEGRDIGTVVFPDAEVKIFLTASDEVRAERRTAELRARGVQTDAADTLREIRERDAQDTSRAVAPMRPAHDAVHVDTSHLSLEQVLERMEQVARARGVR